MASTRTDNASSSAQAAGVSSAFESMLKLAPGEGESPQALCSLCCDLAVDLPTKANAIAALACEALQANVQAFDAENFERCPHKAQTRVASNLQLLLSSSKLVNPRKGAVEHESIRSIPLYHGLLQDSIHSLIQMVEGELARLTNPGTSDSAEAEGTNEKETEEGKKGKGKGGGKEKGKGEAKKSKGADVDGQGGAAAAQGGSALADFGLGVLEHRLAAVLQALAGVAVRSLRRAEVAAEAAKGLGGLPAGLLMVEDVKGMVASIREMDKSAASVLRDVDMDERPAGPPAVVLLGKDVAKALVLAHEVFVHEAVVSLNLLHLRGVAGIGAPANDGPTSVRGKGLTLGRGSAIVCTQFNALQTSDLGWSKPYVWIRSALMPQAAVAKQLVDALKSILEGNDMRRLPKIPKGTRDFTPYQMAIRERAFRIISGVFKRHGAVSLDTPVFELRETLTGKYGEDSKLIYDLADQGGESLSLRYDLTVPFARYMAMYGVGSIKRFHIARVYRRDQPNQKRGRYREFYQCDFDIAGIYATMGADAEVLKVLTEILNELSIGEYEVKLNHRGLLDGMMEICGVPSSMFRAICSAIDKLDKEEWSTVREEMVSLKGLNTEAADKIGEFVQLRGEPEQLLAKLAGEGGPFGASLGAMLALKELELLFKYLKAMGCLSHFVFDLSLARGLDYYTGMIFEAVFKGTSQVGSIAGGGRYDNLVGMFSGKKVPSVGMSVGIERVFAIMEEIEKAKETKLRATETDVLVASLGPEMLQARLEVCAQLWGEKIKAETIIKASLNFTKQLEYALENGIPWMLVFGEDEVKQGIIQIKKVTSDGKESDQPIIVQRSALVQELRKRIGGGDAIIESAITIDASAPTPTTACACFDGGCI